MNSFVFNKFITTDLNSNSNGQFSLFGFGAVSDYARLLSNKKKKIPQSVNVVGVILDELDNDVVIKNFIEFIKTTNTDIVVFGFDEDYDIAENVFEWFKSGFDDINYEELENCYEDRVVFVIKPELRPSCDEVKSENIKEVIKDE